MKRLKIVFSSLILALIALFTFVFNEAKAFTPLDEILDYTIYATPNDDATLNMDYRIKWKVLSDSEGPLEWVKIGVANRYVYDIEATSSNIYDIKYYSDDGAFIRVEFKTKYHAGDIINFSFTFRQERIFTNNNEKIEYEFTPGWFDEISVDKLTVYWNKNITPYDVYTGLVGNRIIDYSENDNWYIWTCDNLGYGAKLKTAIKYDMSSFPNIDLSKDYSDESVNELLIIIVLCIVAFIILVCIILVWLNKKLNSGYDEYRGYSGRSYYSSSYPWFIFHNSHGVNRKGNHIVPPTASSSGGGHSSGGHCACACACACAGGGRAGCSRKDFYYSPSMEKIIDVLDKDKAKK